MLLKKKIETCLSLYLSKTDTRFYYVLVKILAALAAVWAPQQLLGPNSTSLI